MPKKRKNRLHKSQKRRKYKRSGKLSRKKSRKGGMKETTTETETTGLLDMSLLKSRGRGLEGEGMVGNVGTVFHRVVDALGAQAGLGPHDARRHAYNAMLLMINAAMQKGLSYDEYYSKQGDELEKVLRGAGVSWSKVADVAGNIADASAVAGLKSSGKLLDIDEIKRLYDSTFDYLKGLNESQMDETKELIDSQEIDEDKIKFLKNLFNIFTKVDIGTVSSNVPRKIPVFNLKEEKNCFEGYKTIKTLGSGQYGTTYLVENKAGRQFALKQQTILSEEWSPPIEDQIQMVKNEILITEEMGKKNIGPKIYDSYTCEEDGSLKINIVMEYMNAGTLKEWYGKNSFTEYHKEQVEEKINAAHDEDIFHGDLHLENIFVNIGEDGEPEFYLGDFGLGNTLEGLIDVRQQYDTNTFRDTLKTEQNDKYKDIIVKLFIVNGLV